MTAAIPAKFHARARRDAAAFYLTQLAKGVLSKETHKTVVRLAPPLVIAPEELDWALDRFVEVLHELDGTRHRSNAA